MPGSQLPPQPGFPGPAPAPQYGNTATGGLLAGTAGMGNTQNQGQGWGYQKPVNNPSAPYPDPNDGGPQTVGRTWGSGDQYGAGESGSEFNTQAYTDDRTPTFGGYRGGANDTANHYGRMADAWSAAQAPPTDLTNANAARGYGTSALGLDLAAAQGQAPSAAENQFRKDLGASVSTQAAMANSARGGGAALAAAQRSGATQAAAMQAQGAQDAAALRAQEMAQARGLLGQQSMAQQGLDTQTALGLSNQQLEQEQINQRGQLGFYGLGEEAQQAQLQADTAGYTGNLQSTTAANQLGSSNMWQGVGTGAAIGAGLLMMADVHLKEPGGRAHWSLREEPTFLLARNERTGELRKLATEPLSPGERRQAEAPHGAGPLGSMANPRTRVVSDLSLGGGAHYNHPVSEGTKSGQKDPTPLNRFGAAMLGRSMPQAPAAAPAPAGGAPLGGGGRAGAPPTFWNRIGTALRGAAA